MRARAGLDQKNCALTPETGVFQAPPNSDAAEKLARYKGFLKVETHRVKIAHRAGADGREICLARATILDELLRHLWAEARASLSPQAQKEFPPLALIAIGGYGRAELNPHSDIDFMFLHDGQIAGNKPLPYLSKLIDGVLYPLWDVGLKVGYSVRNIEDCIKVANTDMQSKTSLIESRLVIGNESLFKKYQKGGGRQMRRRIQRKNTSRRASRIRRRAARQIRQFRRRCRSRTSKTAVAACALTRTCCGCPSSNTAPARCRTLQEREFVPH